MCAAGVFCGASGNMSYSVCVCVSEILGGQGRVGGEEFEQDMQPPADNTNTVL